MAIASHSHKLRRTTIQNVIRFAGVLIVSALLCVPLAGIVLGAFAPSDGSWAHTVETRLFSQTVTTLLLVCLVTLIATPIGVAAAWCVSAQAFPGRRVLEVALILPIAAPAYITAYVYTDLLEYAGPIQSAFRSMTGLTMGLPPIRSLGGAALVLSFALYPYIYLAARAAFLHQSSSRFAAARSLGARPWEAFRRVALPVARPAILAGLALVLMETMADFGVAEYFGLSTYSVGIYRAWFGLGDPPTALRLSLILLALVAVLLMIENSARRLSEGRSSAADHVARRMRLSPRATLGAVAVCVLPPLLGFVIPFGWLAFLALSNGLAIPQSLMSATGNSILVASLASIVCVLLAVGLAHAFHAARRQSGAMEMAAIRLSTLGYALPGTLLAVGVIVTLSAVDRPFSRWVMDVSGWQTGLILTGTFTALVFAYVIRFLTVAYNSVEPAVAALPQRLIEAGKVLGAKKSEVARKITLPVLTPALLSGGVLVFIDTMRELPATLVLRPLNFQTLAAEVYRLASDERLVEAAPAALVLMGLGLIPVLLISQTARR